MFVIWGRERVVRHIGYVADFCTICRTVQPFSLRRIGLASHIYHISFGQGELVGYERGCLNCRALQEVDIRTYASVSKEPCALPELQARTHPGLEAQLQERLELEHRISDQPLSFSPQERHDLIRKAFLALSPKVEIRFASTHVDLRSGLALLAAPMVFVAGLELANAIVPDSPGVIRLAALVLSVMLVVRQFNAASRRFMQREITPVLSQSLAPLRPTVQELEGVLKELKQHKHKIGRKLRPADLLVSTQREPSVT